MRVYLVNSSNLIVRLRLEEKECVLYVKFKAAFCLLQFEMSQITLRSGFIWA